MAVTPGFSGLNMAGTGTGETTNQPPAATILAVTGPGGATLTNRQANLLAALVEPWSKITGDRSFVDI